MLNDDVVRGLGVTPAQLREVAEREGRELERRESVYRSGRPPLQVAGKVRAVGVSNHAPHEFQMLHRRVPPEARNGLIALLLMAFNGVMPLGQLLAGALAERLGVQHAFQALGAMLLASLLLLFVPRWWQLGRLEWRAERI